jgi:hypothetical protein
MQGLDWEELNVSSISDSERQIGKSWWRELIIPFKSTGCHEMIEMPAERLERFLTMSSGTVGLPDVPTWWIAIP